MQQEMVISGPSTCVGLLVHLNSKPVFGDKACL